MGQHSIAVNALMGGGVHVHTSPGILEHRERRASHRELIHPME